MRTLNNKIARAFFALTACMAMAFGFLACSNDSEPPVVIVVPDNQTKNGGTKTDGGQTSAPVPATIYTITFNANDGSPNPTTVPQNFTAGIPQTLTPVEELGFSKSGFSFAGWGRAPKSTQASYADGASYTATAPATLYALWSEIPVYSVNIPVNENGSVTATPATGSAGTEITLLATPNAGYEFGLFTVTAEDGTDVPVTGNAFTMPDCNVSVSAAFAKIDYSITILAAEYGGVSTENATANYGDTVTLTITPDEGYALATLTYALQDEEPVNVGGSGRQRSFAMPLGDVTIVATFTTIAFSVNVADSIEGGTVAATPTNANAGDQITLVPMANAGWQFVSWNAVAEGGTPVTVENNKFTMPAKNVSVSATFEKINYSITVLPSDNGSVTGLPATATVGTEVSLTASPASGYQFEAFVVAAEGGGNVIVKDGKFSMPASNVMVTAVFSRITYKIDVGAAENGIVTASAAAAAEGADVTLDIAPASGYALEALTVTAVDGSLVSVSGTDTAKNFKMPAQSVAVSASFVLIDALMRGLPLTLEAVEAGVQVTFENNAYGPVIYRINGGNVQTIASDGVGCISLEKAGDKVAFYGDNETYARRYSNSNIKCDKACYIYGNIMSLVKSDAFAAADTLSKSYIFQKLFSNNTHIKNKDGAELLLPATTLVEYCYDGMFSGCTSLTSAPELPATTLASYCYNSMFSGCASLTSAPELPATTLAGSCYYGMFKGCTSLTSAPELPATRLNTECYSGMFKNCTNLTSAPKISATTHAEKSCYQMFCGCTGLESSPDFSDATLAESCCEEMFSDCTSLTRAPALPATTLAPCCYLNMFKNCTSLTRAPALPATTLAGGCYSSMFYGCKCLTSAPELPATTLAGSCYNSMFSGCASLTSAPELPATTLASYCYNSMFSGCASLTSAPELPASTLASYCYNSMFSGCASLTSAPELPATTLAGSCYYGMFSGCASLTSAPELPATTLASYCYNSMFSGCASLTSAPELPASTLASYCYSSMFSGCTSLTSAPELPATTLEGFCYRNMFSGCTSLTEAPDLSATTLAGSCYYGMFSGCASLTSAPELPASTLASYCYYNMFYGCAKLASVTCLATNISATACTKNWLGGVASKGTFIKELGVTIWTEGYSGIPSGWAVKDNNGGSVKILDNIKNGTVKSDASYYYGGQTVTLSISPEIGYKLSSLVVKDEDGEVIETSGTDDSRTFTMPAKNVSVSAEFSAINYSVNVGTSANGSVTASTATSTVGTIVTLAISPASGYEIATLSVTAEGGASVSLNGTGNSRTFTMPAKNVIVTFTFLPPAASGAYKEIDATNVTFGLWPQTIKADDVDIYQNQTKTTGRFTYCRGSDGQWYAKIMEKPYSWNGMTVPKYSDGTYVMWRNNYKWFKVEPIKWRVLTTNYNGTGKKLLFAKSVLVNCRYYDNYDIRTIGEKTVNPNNWEHSKVRAFLNGLSYQKKEASDAAQIACDDFLKKGFLQTAFTSGEQAIIQNTSIDNSARSTNPNNEPSYWNNGKNGWASGTPTTDKVFLLSVQEATTSAYGFSDVAYGLGSRCRHPTDFAMASGVASNVEESGCSPWWLRSSFYFGYSNTCAVQSRGSLEGTTSFSNGSPSRSNVDESEKGVVPALCVSN